VVNETAGVWQVHHGDMACPYIAHSVNSLQIRRVTTNVFECELLNNFQELISHPVGLGCRTMNL